MRTAEEQLKRMHQRAAEIKREEDKSRLRALGSLSGGLMVCLILVLQQLQSLHHGMLTGQGTGSSLLDDNAGGYVLAGVIAFITGVVVTAAIYKWRNWNDRKSDIWRRR